MIATGSIGCVCVQGVITNTQRIDAALPTIRYALDNGAKVCADCVLFGQSLS